MSTKPPGVTKGGGQKINSGGKQKINSGDAADPSTAATHGDSADKKDAGFGVDGKAKNSEDANNK